MSKKILTKYLSKTVWLCYKQNEGNLYGHYTNGIDMQFLTNMELINIHESEA
jgi:hypothetical protein